MTNVVLCPNCGGQKTISKPPYIAGDVNTWSGDTSLYPCPTCEGRGWIRVESVSQDDFDDVKLVALSSMETAENLMDECTKRADRIKELESECDTIDKACVRLATKNILLENMLLRNEAETERLRVKIFDIEGREDLVTTELEHRVDVAEKQRDSMSKLGMENIIKVCDLHTVIHELEADIVCFKSRVKGFRAMVSEKDSKIAGMETRNHFVMKDRDMRERELLETIDNLKLSSDRDTTDLEILDDILKIVNPLIKSGKYAQPMAYYQLLSMNMNELCKTVIQFRHKHGIAG